MKATKYPSASSNRLLCQYDKSARCLMFCILAMLGEMAFVELVS